MTSADRKVRPGRQRVEEAEDMLRALRGGEVDALVVSGPFGPQVYTLEGADAPFRALVEEMNEGAATVSPEGAILYSNRRFADLLQIPLSGVVGLSLVSALSPGDAAGVAALLGRAERGTIDVNVKTREGVVPLKLSVNQLQGGSRAFCIIATDLSESRSREQQLREMHREIEKRLDDLAQTNGELANSRAAALNMMEDAVEARLAAEAAHERLSHEIAERETAELAVHALEEQFRQAQKMEAIGRLAGGIAHDFNNILTAILGYSDLVLDNVAPGSSLASDVSEIKAAGERAARLTQQLLAFSRKQMAVPRNIDLNEVVGGMEKMLGRLINEDVHLAVSLASEVHLVRSDPGLIEQLVMNLVVNARDAMPYGGTLTLRTEDRTLDQAFTATHPGSARGEHVAIVVSDSGCGMSPEVVARIFEPFFTTKGVGQGTGLGLSTVYGIVKQSEGYIDVESTPGRGTTFTVLLPRAVGEPEGAYALPSSESGPRGSETILVVEDERTVGNLIRRSLEPRGYRILYAATADEALALEMAHEGPLDLLLTDIIMPDVNGPTLAADIQSRRPGIRTVYISGFADHSAVDMEQIGRGGAFLHKPFTAECLAAKIRQVLSA